jgi:hypothetical protein
MNVGNTWYTAAVTRCLPARPVRTFSYSMRLGLFLRRAGEQPAHARSLLANFSTPKMEALRSSETSVHTRNAPPHIPENGILHNHRRENLKSYIHLVYFNCLLFDVPLLIL